MKKLVSIFLVITAFVFLIFISDVKVSASQGPNFKLEQQENEAGGNETKIRYIATIEFDSDLNEISEITFYFYLFNPNDPKDQKSATYTTTKVYNEILGKNGKPKALNTYYAVCTVEDVELFSGYTISVAVGCTYHNIKNSYYSNYVSHIIRNNTDSKELVFSNPKSPEYVFTAPKKKSNAVELSKDDYSNTDFLYDNKKDGFGRWNVANKYKSVIYTARFDMNSAYVNEKVIMDFETGNLFFYYEYFDHFYGKTLTLTTYAIRKDDTYSIATEINLNSFKSYIASKNSYVVADGNAKFYTTMSAEDVVLNDESEGEYINNTLNNEYPINKNLLYNIEKYAGLYNPSVLREEDLECASIYGNKEEGYFYLTVADHILVIEDYCLQFDGSTKNNDSFGIYYSENPLVSDSIDLNEYKYYDRNELNLKNDDTYFPFAIAPYEISQLQYGEYFSGLLHNSPEFLKKYFNVQ